MTATAPEMEITLPMPHAGQIAVREQMRRFNFLCCGRRWRKTTLAMAIMVEQALDFSAEYIWAAPTYQQLRRGWLEMERATMGVVQFHINDREAHFPNGSVVSFLPLTEYDNKRGYTSFGTVIDEASEVSAEAYHSVLRPMLSDTDGWLLAFGTPKGRNWFYTEVMRALHGDDPEAQAWVVPTLGATITKEGELVRDEHPLENPHFTWKSLLHEYETTPERIFRQEYLAEFIDDAGGVFRGVEDCVINEPLLDGPPNRVYEYVIGLDLAKYEDYTVLCIGDLRTHKVVAFDRFNKADWTLQKARIIETAKRWNNAIIWQDSTGVGDPIYDDLRAAGLRIHPYQFTSASKDALLNHAVLMVEKHEVTYPRIPVLLDELKALQYTKLPSGRFRMEAPEGMHDDAAMAFSLMCWPMGHSAGSLLSHAALQQLSQPPAQPSPFGGLRLRDRRF